MSPPGWVAGGVLVVGMVGMVGAIAWLLWCRRWTNDPFDRAPAGSRRAVLLLLLVVGAVGAEGARRVAPRAGSDLRAEDARPGPIRRTLGPDGAEGGSPIPFAFAGAVGADAAGSLATGAVSSVRAEGPPVSASLSEASRQAGAARAGSGAFAQEPRPFLHSQHEPVACTDCHGSGDEHRTFFVQTPADCAACHHDPGLPRTCADCHGPELLPAPRLITTAFAPTVWDEPGVRDLPFDHEFHAEVECRECHTGSVMLTYEAECRSCHEEHHAPETDCSQCHVPAADEVHGVEVHLTCSGSGCHAAERGERPALTRNLCLACHVEQIDHELEGDCATCHMIPAHPPQPRGLAGWLSRVGWGR